MKVLLTGGKGMLGRTIVRELGAEFEIVPTDLPEADITDEASFGRVLKEHRPDAVIHCAAATAVDKCEEAIDFAYKLNARGTANVVKTVCGILDELRPRADGSKYESLITYVTDRPGHDLRYAIDPDKLMNKLGWKPLENFETGIRKTVKWYLDNEWWWGPIHSGRYSGQRLGTGK